MKGYVFLSNSTKPNEKESNSREEIKLTNVSRPCLEKAIEMKYDVFFGVNRNRPENLKCELPIKLYDSHTYRSVFNLKDNFEAFKNLRKIIKENNIKVIHCNTPVGGIIGRICGKIYKIPKVIYTAHGFHFYKGAPFLNSVIFKYAEKMMARWTDVIITMNEEDFKAAQKFHLKKEGKVYKIHGVGIDLNQYNFKEDIRYKKRKELGLEENDIILISAGDLVKRKNYDVALRAIAKLNNSKIHYLICGDGVEYNNLKKLADELKIEKNVHFLGFRNDVKELFTASDIFLFTTLQEGLPRSLMEAMACGLPCIVSKIRGNIDLIKENVGGLCFEPFDVDGFSNGIDFLIKNSKLINEMSKFNLEEIKKYDINVVKNEINIIYEEKLI